jgi:hypothetical protein
VTYYTNFSIAQAMLWRASVAVLMSEMRFESKQDSGFCCQNFWVILEGCHSQEEVAKVVMGFRMKLNILGRVHTSLTSLNVSEYGLGSPYEVAGPSSHWSGQIEMLLTYGRCPNNS